MSEQDTREQLEGDTREEIEADIYCYRVENDSQILSVPIYRVKSWLNRQTAITKQQCEKREDEIVDAWQSYLAKVEDERDELTAERDELQKVVRIQAESFKKLEQELKEARDGIRAKDGPDLPDGEGPQPERDTV